MSKQFKKSGNNHNKGKRGSNNKRIPHKDTKLSNEDYKSIESSTNDIGWHALSDQMLRDAASFSFGYFNGRRTPYKVTSGLTPDKITDTHSGNLDTTGIMTLALTPTVGKSTDITSPINMAAQMEYSKLRTKNSGIYNLFQKMDLIMYILSFNEIIKYVSVARRLYGYLATFESRSAYSPRAVITAMGFDYDDFAVHRADYRAWLNIFIKRANKVFAPKHWRMFAESDYLYSNIFRDKDQEQSQLYVIKPQLFLKWNGFIDEQGTALEPVLFTPSKWTTPYPDLWDFSEFKVLGDKLLHDLVENDDTGYIGGAILNYYGEENCWQFAEVPDDYMIYPIFDEILAYRIENCTSVGSPKLVAYEGEGAEWEPYIKQKQGSPEDPNADNYVYCDLLTISDYPDHLIKPILNVPARLTDPASVMEITRWTNAANYQSEVLDGDYHVFEASYEMTSLNMVTAIDVYCYKFDITTHLWELVHMKEDELSTGTIFLDKGGATNVNSKMNIISRLSQFAHCPHFVLAAVASSTTRTFYFNGQMCDLESYYILEPTDMYKLHMCDLITEFGE